MNHSEIKKSSAFHKPGGGPSARIDETGSGVGGSHSNGNMERRASNSRVGGVNVLLQQFLDDSCRESDCGEELLRRFDFDSLAPLADINEVEAAGHGLPASIILDEAGETS